MTTYQGIHGNYTIKEPRLAKGGEGEVFELRGRNDLVLKRFAEKHRTATRHNKLQAMIRAGLPRQLLDQMTWPVDVVYDNGQFVGYVMPKLTKSENLNTIYSDRYSLKLEDRITIAMNLCVPVDALHQLGQYVGDGNPQNICVDPKNLTVTLVDTDSYTITDRASGRIYPCMVGLGSYLAPEVQAAMKQYHGLTRVPADTFNEYTDRFWLAVHIFALLMNGAHPFAVAGTQIHMSQAVSSVNLPQPDENICSGYFPHSGLQPGHKIPAYCPKMDYLPVSTQNLFIRAFVTGHRNPSVRPSAKEWFAELLQLRGHLRSGTHCRKPKHQYPDSAAFCPWCELEKRTVPKPPPLPAGVQTGQTGGGGGAAGGGGGRKAAGGCLNALGVILGCLISLAILLALPVACTANMMNIHESEQAAKQEAAQQKMEELRQQAEQQAEQDPEQNAGMQADGSWIHPHETRVLQVQSAAYHNLTSSLSDTMEMMEFTLQPGLTGIHCLETGDQDLELRVRVYDDTGYCLASYISEENGDGTSMELESGRLYTVKVERRYADSGAFCLRWWMQKEQEDITNYGSVNDTIEFSQQVNVYQFRCAAAAACQVLCTSADPDLRLSIHIYDEYGNRINSGIGVERGFGPSADLEVGKTYTIHVNSYTGYGNYSLAVKKAG